MDNGEEEGLVRMDYDEKFGVVNLNIVLGILKDMMSS